MKIRASAVALWIIIALVLAACSSTGETTTNTLSLDYPDADPVRVALNIREGELNVRRSGTDNLTTSVTTNVPQWQASAESAGDTLRITQGSAGRTEVIIDAANEWDVALGDNAPLALDINHGTANANLNLGGLNLASVDINGASGNLNLNFDAPVIGDEGRVYNAELETGNISATNLLNSRAQSINFATASGSTNLEFNGDDLIQDLRSRVEARTGNVVIRVPEGLPIRVTFDSTSGVLRQVSSGFIQVENNIFETAEYADADQPRVLIEVQTVTGTLQLEIVADL